MKFFILLLCITLTVALVPPVPQTSAPVANKPASPPAVVAPVLPQSTVAQDLRDLKQLFPTKEISYLCLRYLLNDPEFQGVVRTLNTHVCSMAQRRFYRLPEIRNFLIRYRTQLKQSPAASPEITQVSPNELVVLFNKSPYWSNAVYGWQGFINEFMMTFPEYLIQQTIQTKLTQSPSFAGFWRALGGIRPAFDAWLLQPDTQECIIQLQEFGVDTLQLESLIRLNLNWVVPPPALTPPVGPAPVEPAPVEPVEPVLPVEPIEPVPVEPVEVVPVEPVEPVPVEPAEVVPVEPVEVVPVEPAEVVPVEPVEVVPVEPAEVVPVEPAEVVPVEPAEVVPVEPAEPVPAA